MIILGIDIGFTAANPLGAAVISGTDLVQTTCFKPSANVGSGMPSQLDVLRQLSVFRFKTQVIDAIAIEAAHYTGNPQTFARLSEMVGMVAGWAGLLGYGVVLVQPSEAKLALTGDGSADKAAMIKAVLQQFSIAVRKDEADAVGVALVGRAKFRVTA